MSSDLLRADEASSLLTGKPAGEIIHWANEIFSDRLVASSSFGIGSAPFLHLLTQVVPGMPIIFVDTGYHFDETLDYLTQLQELLNLNVKVVKATETPSEMEALFGKLWETDISYYNQRRKVAPLRRALEELKTIAWIVGLRANETALRATLPLVEQTESVFKVYPILHWDDVSLEHYMEKYSLPEHPLAAKGYASIGDWHSTSKLTYAGQPLRETRHLARIIHDTPTASVNCPILPALCTFFRPRCASAHCRPKKVTKHQ